MGYFGAGGKLIHEKNQNQKSLDTVPLKPWDFKKLNIWMYKDFLKIYNLFTKLVGKNPNIYFYIICFNKESESKIYSIVTRKCLL